MFWKQNLINVFNKDLNKSMKNMSKKITLSSLLVVFFLFAFVFDADAQRKKRRVRPGEKEELKDPSSSFADKLNYEIKLGNIGFGNNFSLSLKPNVGYKFHKFASAGVGSRIFYTLINRTGIQDLSLFDYGFFGYGRVRLGESFYLQGEYTTLSLDLDTAGRRNLNYPLLGAGYLSGNGPWKAGFELLIIANDEARDNLGQVVEWWFNFSYNF